LRFDDVFLHYVIGRMIIMYWLIALLFIINEIDFLLTLVGDGPLRLIFYQRFAHLAELRIFAVGVHAWRRKVFLFPICLEVLAFVYGHVSIHAEDGWLFNHILDGNFMRLRFL
jgi:hypothetical protein